MTTQTMRVQRKDLVDRHDAADILGVHPNTIDRMGRDRLLRRFHIRGVRGVFYLRSDVEDCIEEILSDTDGETAAAPEPAPEGVATGAARITDTVRQGTITHA